MEAELSEILSCIDNLTLVSKQPTGLLSQDNCAIPFIIQLDKTQHFVMTKNKLILFISSFIHCTSKYFKQ